MTRWIAFLRGINLGKRRLGMDELREHFEDLGVEDVATFFASGNVAFLHPEADPAELEGRIEAHLEGRLGYPVGTVLRTLDELSRVAETDADEADEGFKAHVVLSKHAQGAAAERALQELATEDDRFRVLEREVVWLRRGGMARAPITSRDLEKALDDDAVTVRTMGTVRKIVAKCEA